ncbi:hypothetical protein EVAR_41338_1 [Eumeta japonica]|uniref:Uncharacterized protein n=1 Tax=Eumeta variegata TaxID=151549 RepID=A0A4C1X563_EUMVA|nr:hypothetical protein EVAR_41338_1 [Eumeta japonica]
MILAPPGDVTSELPNCCLEIEYNSENDEGRLSLKEWGDGMREWAPSPQNGEPHLTFCSQNELNVARGSFTESICSSRQRARWSPLTVSTYIA